MMGSRFILGVGRAGLLGVLLVGVATPAGGQPLRRSLDDYVILALRRAALKNISVDGPCNLGVNCASTNPGSDCGILRVDGVTFAAGSQIAADQAFFTKPGSVVHQLFRNGGGPLDDVTVNAPPVQPFAPPILPGTCSAQCEPDYPALEQACGFPDPFPACGGPKIQVRRGDDCAADTTPGNGRCDLGPGTYGDVNVQNGASLALAPGTYVLCDLIVGRNALVTGSGTTILLADGGRFRVNNGSQLGQECGELTVLIQGDGALSFGRNGRIAARICGPRASFSLGHNNLLLGQFIGDRITANFRNHAQCCAGRCACFDELAPTAAAPGAEVTLTTECDLSATTAVRVCGVPATVLSQTMAELRFTVPAVPPGSCPVEVESPAGTFVHVQPLTIP